MEIYLWTITLLKKMKSAMTKKTVEYGFDSCHYIDFWAFPTNKCMSFDVPKYEIICDVKNVW